LVWERSGSAVPGGRERGLKVRERGGKRVGSARERDGSGQGRERDFRLGSAVREVRSAAGSAVPGRSRSERESEVRTGGGGDASATLTEGVPLDTKLPHEETLQGGVLSLACLTLYRPTG
jgi:hypothetical protein